MTEQRLRRTLLYVPGNMPSMLQNMSVFGSDAIIIDLEDAVPHTEKDAARRLVRRFLEGYRERDKEILVRINALDTAWAYDDLREVLPAPSRTAFASPRPTRPRSWSASTPSSRSSRRSSASRSAASGSCRPSRARSA